MNINYKFIKHETIGDAPFIGALICGTTCKLKCKNCHNQHLKDLPVKTKSAKEIITEIKSNTFNHGIIFGGLEWTFQMKEAIFLACLAQESELKTILYTGKNDLLPEDMQCFDFVKIGEYMEERYSPRKTKYGVILASDNQKILERGVDY